jgi:hypothetical protein
LPLVLVVTEFCRTAGTMSDLLFADLSVFLRLLSALPFGLPLA